MIKFTKDDANKTSEETKKNPKKKIPLTSIYTAVMIAGCILVTLNGVRIYVRSFDRGDTTPASVVVQDQEPEKEDVMKIDIDKESPVAQELLKKWEAEGKVVDTKAPSVDDLDPEFQELYQKLKDEAAREQAKKQQYYQDSQDTDFSSGYNTSVKSGGGAAGDKVNSSIRPSVSVNRQEAVSGKPVGEVIGQTEQKNNMPAEQAVMDESSLLDSLMNF